MSLYVPVTEDIPYSCTFEDHDFCTLLQSVTDDEFDWQIERDATSTINTGPDGSFQGTYYAYIEASGENRSPGERAM